LAAFADPRTDLADLTAARAGLALWVFVYHANLHLFFADPGGLIGRGYLGVDGFFILSGLVLAHRHPAPRQTPGAYGRFWWRRFVRLYPTALAMLLLLGLLFLLARAGGVHPHQSLRASGREFLLQLFLLNGWGFSDGWSWNYPSWSISTEWAGYLVFPALALFASRLGRGAVLAGLVAMGILLLAVALLSPVGLNLSYQGALPRFLPEFVAGVLLARLLRLGVSPLPPEVAGACGVIIFAAGIWLRRDLLAGDAVVAIGLWFLLWAAAAGPQRLFARLPVFIRLGALSYPFYMAYAPIEVLVSRYWHANHGDPARWPYFWLVVMFLSVLALASVTARYVERPLLRHLAGRRLDS
jgi:peptidoglycan/LPS O-acetylase OafA/YrhL